MKNHQNQNRRKIGYELEAAVSQHYLEQGYQFEAKNYYYRGGEIDLIFSKEDILVFVEVKALSYGSIESLSDQINSKKQEKLILGAQNYLENHPKYKNFIIRFDVAGITADKKTVDILNHAFEENWVV